MIVRWVLVMAPCLAEALLVKVAGLRCSRRAKVVRFCMTQQAAVACRGVVTGGCLQSIGFKGDSVWVRGCGPSW